MSDMLECKLIGKLQLSKEMGTWTIRINGQYVDSFFREARARRVAMGIIRAFQEFDSPISRPE